MSLVGLDPHARTDYISGGGKEKDANGRMKRTRETSLSPRIAARAAMKQGRPIGIVAGESDHLLCWLSLY